MKYTEEQLDLMRKASKGMVGGRIHQYPILLDILKEQKLIYESEEDQPVNRFINEFSKILRELRR